MQAFLSQLGGSEEVGVGDASLTAGLLSPKTVVAMEEVLRLVSGGDCIKIWDAGSIKMLDQFSPHSSTHPVSQVCWSSNSILDSPFYYPCSEM